jgi:site-specific DNA-methyltransferase (adenine-specific)
MESRILTGDCFELIKDIQDNSIDLIITSPPYADIVNYGKNISIKKPNEYCDWLLPLFDEIYRVLKPSGSFILNINDNCSNGLRNPFIYELIYRSQKETKLKFYDTYIWHKKNGIPNGGKKRFRNNTEFIFHFVKNQKELKFYMDRVMKEPAESYSERKKYKWKVTNHGQTEDGQRVAKEMIDGKDLPDLVRPDNVVRFHTAGHARDNTIKHPAPFYKDLPAHYIKFLTDEGDVVLDVFSGIGTTGMACKELNRDYIGMELNEKYAEFSEKRINGDELEVNYVVQYDLQDNLLNIFRTIGEAEKHLGHTTHNHIEDCLRKGNPTAYGYKWKLEKNKWERLN